MKKSGELQNTGLQTIESLIMRARVRQDRVLSTDNKYLPLRAYLDLESKNES